RPEYFVPYIGVTSELCVRTRGDAAAAVRDLAAVARSADPGVLVLGATTLEDRVAELGAGRWLQTSLMTMFATLALVLCGLGVHGVVHHAVSRRVRELGIRVALGASRGAIVRLILREGLL